MKSSAGLIVDNNITCTLSSILLSYYPMAVHKPVARAGIYFITFTCYKWLHLIGKTNAYDIVYHFLSHLNQKGHQVVGYTIMPNHVHLLLFFAGDTKSLNTVIGNLKRFIGYEIIKHLQAQNDKETLAILAQGVEDAERKRGKLHQLWQGSFDVKECRTEKFILQKLNYMHQNPCVERWGLCKNTYDYVHSSAAFYEKGNRNNKLLRDYREFMGLLLESEESGREEQNR
jgi:REP element-mobilizing transposase RayT